MIELRNIQIDLKAKGSSKTVSIDHVHLRAGDVGALVGDNGSGKTTILRSAANSISPRQGKVTLSRPLIPVTDIERQLNYRLTLVENHRLYSALYGLRRPSRQIIMDNLDLAGLSSVSEKRAGSLSKGEKARLVFSIIRSHDCQSFIVDEPTNGLDDNGKRYVQDVIRHKLLSGAAGLISSHDQDFCHAIGAKQYRSDGQGAFSEYRASETIMPTGEQYA